MNSSTVLLLVLLALTGVTCSAPPEVMAPPPLSQAERQMQLAGTLAQSGDFRRAIHVYSMVAESSPGTPWGATATYRAALLLSSPRNPSRDDSLALVWFRSTIARTRSEDERLQAEVCIALLDRLHVRSTDARRQRAIVDSLQTSLRRQSGTILSQTRRLQDMEREVLTAQSELRRLKEVDVTLSRTQQIR